MYRQIAAGSPQWPQAFYPMKKIDTVQPGEVVTARCSYNSTGVNHETHIGGTAGDEMCNLYIMYFTEVSKSPGDYLTCAGEQAGHYITRGLPADSDLVPEKRPELEAKASDSSATGGPNEINYAQLFEEELLKGTSKKKVLDQPDGMVVQAQLNVTMPGTCKCGIKKTTRIVGGTETEVNEYPWIAAFDFSGTSGTSPGGCAATLISTNWAVTASHCFYNQQGELVVTKDTMSLVLGVHDRTGTTDTNRQVLTIAEIVLHPSYNPSGSSHDIALLKISETVDLDTWSPACLPTSGADFTGQNGWVYGWGATSEGGSLADKLLELEVPIVSDSVCASAMSSGGVSITSDMLCAGLLIINTNGILNTTIIISVIGIIDIDTIIFKQVKHRRG